MAEERAAEDGALGLYSCNSADMIRPSRAWEWDEAMTNGRRGVHRMGYDFDIAILFSRTVRGVR